MPDDSARPYKPGERILCAAREELKELLAGELDVRSLVAIQTVAQHCHRLTMALDPEGVVSAASGAPLFTSTGIDLPMPVGPYGMRDETFGSKAVREAVAVLREVVDTRRVSDLVTAISKAEASGLVDVARQLRTRLDQMLESKPQEASGDGSSAADKPTLALPAPVASSVIPEQGMVTA